MSGSARPRWTRRLAVVAVVAGISLVAARAPATVEEQRARLPPAATDCEDPVAGVWKSHKYDPRFGDWYSFTLTIDRDPNDPRKLVGTIHSHSWSGGPQQEEPPPCTAGVWHWTVMMTAEGTVTDDGRIHFGGTSWRFENAYCGRALGSGEYNLDNFSGIIDPEIMEFQSVNNDGGRSINDPTVFRRISCNQAPPSPHVNPVPPPFLPDQGGCGCGLF